MSEFPSSPQSLRSSGKGKMVNKFSLDLRRFTLSSRTGSLAGHGRLRAFSQVLLFLHSLLFALSIYLVRWFWTFWKISIAVQITHFFLLRLFSTIL